MCLSPHHLNGNIAALQAYDTIEVFYNLCQQIHFFFRSSSTLDPNRIIFFVPTTSLLTGQLLCLCSELRGALFRNRFRSQTWSWLYSRLVQPEADKTVPRNAPIAQVHTGRKSKKKKKKKAPSWIRSTCDLFGRFADEWDQTIDVLATHSLRFDPCRSIKRRPVAALTATGKNVHRLHGPLVWWSWKRIDVLKGASWNRSASYVDFQVLLISFKEI